MLATHYSDKRYEAGCDEAGRGCLAGPVYAAAVILPPDYCNTMLDDSKKLTERQRNELRKQIEADAIAWAVAAVDNDEIDQMNILRASFHAMNKAVMQLTTQPEMLLIDGNRFVNETSIPYACIVKGDGKYQSIAAASILAKTYRDDFMNEQHRLHPQYGWDKNKGYPTTKHYAAIEEYGITNLHRRSYKLSRQTELVFDVSSEKQ